MNISLPLPAISRKRCLEQNNRVGFYWNVPSEEPIVSHTQKADSSIISATIINQNINGIQTYLGVKK